MKNIATAALDADIPLMLWGPPGIGKTARVQAWAAAADVHLEILIGSQMDPTDVGGLPIPHGREVELAAPAWARRIRTALDAGRGAWLLLDELTTSAPSVRAALLRVVHDRCVAGLDLRGCRMLAAGNDTEHAADGGSLDAATANRYIHLRLGADPDIHFPGLLSGWGRGTSAEAPHRAAIVDFLRARPGALLAPPSHEVGSAGAAWPSPRSWDALCRIAGRDDGSITHALAAACIGDATATELSAYLAARDLPDPAALLDGSTKLPARGDRTLAAWEGLVAYVLALRGEPREAAEKTMWSTVWASVTRRDIALQLARAAIVASDACQQQWDTRYTASAVALAKKINA